MIGTLFELLGGLLIPTEAELDEWEDERERREEAREAEEAAFRAWEDSFYYDD